MRTDSKYIDLGTLTLTLTLGFSLSFVQQSAISFDTVPLIAICKQCFITLKKAPLSHQAGV